MKPNYLQGQSSKSETNKSNKSSDHSQYFESLEQKLLKESQKLTNLMDKPNVAFDLKAIKGQLTEIKRKYETREEKASPIQGKITSLFPQTNKQILRGNRVVKMLSGSSGLFQPQDQIDSPVDKKHQLQRKLTYQLIQAQRDLGEIDPTQSLISVHSLGEKKNSGSPFKQLKLTTSTTGSTEIYQKNKTFEQIKRLSNKSIQSSKSSSSVLNKKIKIEDFQILKYLEEGQFGTVYIVRHKKLNFISALKKIPKSIFQGDHRFISQLIRQIKIQSYLDHPNIVQLYCFFSDEEYLYLLLELCTSGNVYNSLKKLGRFPEGRVRTILNQLCHAIQFMHDNDIIHRDIKPQNILLHDDIVKVCDFGWSINSPLLRDTRCGTPLYSSPELVQKLQYDNKIDVWNIGILAYQLLFGRVPFEIRSEDDLIKVVDEEIYFPKAIQISKQAKDFILKCLQKNPQKRLSLTKLIDHQFLEK